MISIKSLGGALAGMVIGLLIVAVAIIVPDILFPKPKVVIMSQPNPTAVAFIQLCSGLDVTGEQSALVATANCLGRIRGYVDSHQQTFYMLQRHYSIPNTAQLWCVPRKITDKELLSVVVAWIEANPKGYSVIITNYSDTTAAMGVIAAAMQSTHPCTK